MDYKSDSSSFIVGLQSNYFNDTINEPIMNIFPKSEWNKIYIDLSNVVNARINANSFNIYLYIDKPNNSMLRSLYIDNFKIIHL